MELNKEEVVVKEIQDSIEQGNKEFLFKHQISLSAKEILEQNHLLKEKIETIH